MTGKLEGLWDPIPALPGMVPVTKEDIGHMTKRVYQFDALVPVAEGQLVSVPPCKESFCRWLVARLATPPAGGWKGLCACFLAAPFPRCQAKPLCPCL